MHYKDIVLGSVIGHVVGDALGVPVEFIPRDKLAKHLVNDMLEYGTHHKPKGTWSDDSSMMLCTLASIIESQGIDYNDVMQRYSRWAKEGYLTPDGSAFGVGRTTLRALGKFWRGEEAVNCGCSSEKDNGNGSLMRILPVALYTSLKQEHQPTIDERINYIHQASALTHAHNRACIACGIYKFVLQEIIAVQNKFAIIDGLKKAKNHYNGYPEIVAFERLFSDDFLKIQSDEIKSSGYVVDTLEAAIWCLLRTDNYKECVLQAVNLGGDTDTIAAVAGALAGILYGHENIPQEWKDSIIKIDMIIDMCNRFCKIV